MKTLNDNEHINLIERPNIYMFILESYHDLNTMHDIYNIDTKPLESYVLAHDFLIYENVYSNSTYTLSSMADILGMRLGISKEMGIHDTAINTRTLIGGGPGNQVYRILKENGYHTIYLVSTEPLYYFHNKGIYLDDTNVDFRFSIRPLCELSKPLYRYFYGNDDGEGTINNIYPKFRNTLKNNIHMIIEESDKKMPLFIGFKSGAIHTDTFLHTWKQKNEWILSKKYQESITVSNQEIFEIVDLIIEKDPSAVIILIGDHGVGRLRNIWKDAARQGQGIANLNTFLKQNGETLDALASDIFGTFLAIRMPGKGDISNGLPMSHVNLFRHIFAALADNDTGRDILQHRAPSESDLYGIILLKDAIVQRPVEPATK